MTFRGLFPVVLLTFFFSFPAPAVSPEIQRLIGQAFSEKSTADMELALKKASDRAKDPADKKFVYTAQASLSERLGNPAVAGRQYREAALAIPGKRDDSLYLDAVRCALASNDTAQAGEMVREVLLSSFDETTLIRARVYSAWIQLASGERDNALDLLRSYAGNSQFELYAPALLFTIWWATADRQVAQTLQSRYPASPEAAAVRGELLTGPSSFWYLMTRDGMPSFALAESPTPSQNTESRTTDTKTVQTSPSPEAEPPAVKPSAGNIWQQTGFFRNRENAESMATVLRQRGFSPVVREETRPSGTVYFAVLVPDDGTAALRLKDEGFESYLVRD